MKKILLAILALVVLPPWALAATTYSAGSCDKTEVQGLVAGASAGDTVTVPACAETTWASRLTVTVPIILQGAGIDSTNIKAGFTGGTLYGVIHYVPSSPSPSDRFTVTGFTINTDYRADGIGIVSQSTTPTTVLIHDNKITKVGSTGGLNKGIRGYATVYGVVYNNTFELSSGPAFSMYGVGSGGVDSWTAFESVRAFGSSNAIFFEDNTVTSTGGATFIDGGLGERVVYRYNSFNGDYNWSPGIDMHGGQEASFGGLLFEGYGNIFNAYSHGMGKLFDQRGGMAAFFYNQIVNGISSDTYVREEFPDHMFPSVNSFTQHVTNSYYWGNWKSGSSLLVAYIDTSENCCQNTEAWQPNHNYGTSVYCAKFTDDTNGNCWKGSSGSYGSSSPYTSGGTVPNFSGTAVGSRVTDNKSVWLNMGPTENHLVANVDFFTQRTGTFNGTGDTAAGGGVGCGTVAAMNAITTCTDGVGYWVPNATADPTAASCSSLTGRVGVSPATPISGTLYKCASNAWTNFYTPQGYPHYLRTGGGGEGSPDITRPTVDLFAIPATAASLTVSISSFTASDNVGVTGYCVNESSSAPTAGSCSGSGWAGSRQTSYTFANAGAKTLYAWAKDAAGNISTSLNDSVTITLPEAGPGAVVLTGGSMSGGFRQ